MIFSNNTLFHIYNQGNNGQKIFYSDENYSYFLWKMRAYLLPFGQIVAYCLMPNHFHWLLYVENKDIERIEFRKLVNQIENQRRIQKYGSKAILVDHNAGTSMSQNKLISLNESIGILQKTYTRAFNKENNQTGSLFRSQCKAKDGWIDEFVTVRNTKDYRFSSSNEFAYDCMNYIHNNPVKAGLAKVKTDWKFSSARDYKNLRKGTLVNTEIGKNIIDYL